MYNVLYIDVNIAQFLQRQKVMSLWREIVRATNSESWHGGCLTVAILTRRRDEQKYHPHQQGKK
jgi:hypothetical protein